MFRRHRAGETWNPRCLLLTKLLERTDRQLVELCIKGHSAAWQVLVNRYKRLVYHFPNAAGLHREDCDEIFQETFLAFHRNLEKLLQVDELGHWVATVAQRITWKTLHRNRRRREDELPEAYEVEDPSQLPLQEVEVRLQQSKVRYALKLLNRRCQKLLGLLFYKYESSDYDRIAEEAGIARGSIGPIRQRCLAKFKEKLAGLGINQKNVSRWFQ